MKHIARSRIVPSLVRAVDQTTTYPGYKYIYFKTFEELDTYFRELCGTDWLDQEWAKFWLRDHWKTAKQEARVLSDVGTGRIPKAKRARVPRYILKALVAKYQDEGFSLREIAALLQEQDGISLTYSALSRIMSKKEPCL